MKMYILVTSEKLSKGFIAGQVGHIVSLFLYHGYIINDWNYAPKLPTINELNQYFNSHITKIILKVPESKLLELKNKNYLVVDDYNQQLNKRLLTTAFGGLYYDDEVPKWLSKFRLL